MQEVSVLAAFAPSFNSYSTIRLAEIADKVIEREKFGLDQSSTEEEKDQAQDDFEFAFVYRDSDASQSISADEIFSNGKILPMFPVFDQNVLLVSHDNSIVHNKEVHSNKQLLTKASSGRGTSKTVPSLPITCKKCYSCGSTRRFRLKDLIHRSNSDVNDSFVFFSPSSSSTKNRSKPKKSSDEKKANEKSSEVLNTVAKKKNDVKANAKILSHEHYIRNRALKEKDRRRTYLPYRRDLIGFFGYLNGWSFGKLHQTASQS